jgi:hypothetical protein
MLGVPLSRAWRGDYESAAETLAEVRQILQSSGRQLSGDYMDGLVDFDPEATFKAVRGVYGRNVELSFRNGQDMQSREKVSW